ncbi:MAG TPA: hypothetical protein VE953_17595 [Terriglobales bacterium]|nr:hypothetical protein [Terriglobales bacterium]
MRWAWAWVGLAAAALIGALAAIWWHSGETTAGTLATVVAAVLAATGPLASWLPARAEEPGTIDDRLELLATVLRVQWEREANVRQLHDPQPIVVRWTAADPRLTDHAEVIAGGRQRGRGPAPAGRLEEVVDEFARLPRRRLVVIGEPGAGKSSVLLLLTLGLLARRTPADPVPVLLSVASWDPARSGFPQWLARRLSDEYPFVRPDDARAIVEAGRVLPLLDGLDELPDAAVAAAVTMINRAGLERPVVVACRTREFAQAVHASDVLTAAAVVELEPVGPDQAERYLRLTTPPDDRLARWEPVFAELRRGPSSPVAAALSTPLMVTLTRTVYALDRAADPGELVRCASREAIEDRLLDALLPALFGAGSTRWTADRARVWLAFLAAHLRRRGTRDLAWWELARGGALRWIRRGLGLGFVAGLVAGLLAELVADLATGTGFNLSFEITVSLTGAVWTATLAGIGSAIVVGLRLFGRAALSGPSRLRLRLDRFFLRRFSIGLVIGIPIALPLVYLYLLLESLYVGGFAPGLGLSDWLLAAGYVALVVGLPVGVGFGLVFGLVRQVEQPPAPGSSLRANRLASLFTLVMGSLGLAAVTGVAAVLGGGLSLLTSGVALGLVAGMPIALGMAAVLPWSGYQVAHLWLSLRHRLPWRLFAFLEEAHQRGILRQVGGVYQFRHARLQDRLAGP